MIIYAHDCNFLCSETIGIDKDVPYLLNMNEESQGGKIVFRTVSGVLPLKASRNTQIEAYTTDPKGYTCIFIMP